MSEKTESDILSSAKDVKQLGLWASIASLSYVFWIVGGMEMVERLAYYGVKAVAAIYATESVADGGLGITMTQFGVVLTVWALIQSWVPVLTGGLSDRFGYKETIFASTILKMAGYILMALFPTFEGFFAGAVVLAFGTGIFKPGIQGTLVKSTNRQNSSMAWGIFYQTVNIGGFLGPIVAAALRQFEWTYVFYACTAMISCNLLLLATYKEPGIEERLERKRLIKAGELAQDNLFLASLKELVRPVLIVYLVVFSGFWYMFNALFDILPVYINEWVDTSVIVTSIFGPEGTDNGFLIRLMGLSNDGMRVMPEGLMNINAGMIMLICFLVAGFGAKLKAINAISVGTLLCGAAYLMIGSYNAAWMIAIAIAAFSIGEMLSSPKFLEYLGNMAPADKKAMYLGFSQLPLGIGWTLEAATAPMMYDMWASKDTLSREYLLGQGMPLTDVDTIPVGEAFDRVVTFSQMGAAEAQNMLYAANSVGDIWYVMAAMGFLSAIGLYMYGRWVMSLHNAK